MTSTQPTEARIQELERWAQRRRGRSGYEQNVRDIEAEIARLKEAE